MWSGLIDIHAHLDMMDEGVDQVLEQASAVGVSRIVTIGTEPSDHDFVLKTAQKYFPRVACTLGVHPHQGMVWDESIADYLLKNAPSKECIAIGEIGLDYYYEKSSRDQQKLAFRRQMEVAAQLGMPVEIHTRDAEEDTAEILKEFEGRVRGVIHCFTSSQWLADRCLDLGYNISISGVVTFKNAEALRQVVRSLPLDRIHVETDAPFLAPVPVRGQPNRPAFVHHTAKFVADLKGISFDELVRITNENALRMFPKLGS